MTPAELDSWLDDPCPVCGREYRGCVCHTDTRPAAEVDEDVVALSISSAWMTRHSLDDFATGMRAWAAYRRAQERA